MPCRWVNLSKSAHLRLAELLRASRFQFQGSDEDELRAYGEQLLRQAYSSTNIRGRDA